MSPYRFKLQTVLDYRDEQLNRVQQKMAEAEGQRLEILKRIQAYDNMINQAFQDQQSLHTQTILDPVLMRQFPQYIWQLRENRFQELQVLQAHEEVLLRIREELKQALIRKKSLVILKEKDEERTRQRIEKAEEEFLSELALRRASKIKR